jgi:hypothetical protein
MVVGEAHCPQAHERTSRQRIAMQVKPLWTQAFCGERQDS